jgi:hypothetical protein
MDKTIYRYSVARNIEVLANKPTVVFTINDMFKNDSVMMSFNVTTSERETLAVVAAVRSLMDDDARNGINYDAATAVFN